MGHLCGGSGLMLLSGVWISPELGVESRMPYNIADAIFGVSANFSRAACK